MRLLTSTHHLALLLSAISPITALPQVLTQPGIIPNNTANLPILPSSQLSNLSDPEIFCREPFDSNPPIASVSSCRATLNELRTFPDYKLRQGFIETTDPSFSKPRRPHKPPYVSDNPGSDCAVLIGATVKNQWSWFSFEEARSLAQEIVQYCGEEGGAGRGGSAAIGLDEAGRRMNFWAVTVIGRKRDDGDVVLPDTS